MSSRFSIFQAARGYGVILDGVDTDGTTYKLYLAHLDGIWLDTASAEAPGTPLAKLFGPLNHVHIEVMQNGTPQKPEDLGICTT